MKYSRFYVQTMNMFGGILRNRYILAGFVGIGSTYLYNKNKKNIFCGSGLAVSGSTLSIAGSTSYLYENESAKYIVIGAGTGGCLTAYFLAKWMEDLNIPGDVILLEGGDDYVSKNGPSPKMEKWYENWKQFCIVHENNQSNFEPAVASSHIGVGGGSTHDTRITFIPTDQQRKRLADEMGWTIDELNVYYQSVLNMIPIQSANCGERFYDEVIKTLSESKTLTNETGKVDIIGDSILYVSMAMFPDESRWTCAYLLDDSIRPKRLKVKTGWTADKIIFKKSVSGSIDPVSVVSSNGEYIDIKQNGEIIITAGSFGTTAILQRSGIGPKALFSDLGIMPIYVNNEIGHGVDHPEVPVSYEWLDKWNEKDGKVPRGGPMAWPLAIFLKDENGKSVMAHFGISPPPYENGMEVTGTPNCSSPDASKGFFARIRSINAKEPMFIEHIYSEKDIEQISRGVRKMVNIFELMKKEDIVGDRKQPSKEIDINNDEQLNDWIKNNLGTAYHWMCTCRAGKSSSVVDEKFKLKGVNGVRIGSGAVLPEIPEANPHLTISAFSIALAHSIIKDNCPLLVRMDADGFSLRSIGIKDFCELENAQNTLKSNNGKYVLRHAENVKPDLRKLIIEHINIKNKD